MKLLAQAELVLSEMKSNGRSRSGHDLVLLSIRRYGFDHYATA